MGGVKPFATLQLGHVAVGARDARARLPGTGHLGLPEGEMGRREIGPGVGIVVARRTGLDRRRLQVHRVWLVTGAALADLAIGRRGFHGKGGFADPHGRRRAVPEDRRGERHDRVVPVCFRRVPRIGQPGVEAHAVPALPERPRLRPVAGLADGEPGPLDPFRFQQRYFG